MPSGKRNQARRRTPTTPEPSAAGRSRGRSAQAASPADAPLAADAGALTALGGEGIGVSGVGVTPALPKTEAPPLGARQTHGSRTDLPLALVVPVLDHAGRGEHDNG